MSLAAWCRQAEPGTVRAGHGASGERRAGLIAREYSQNSLQAGQQQLECCRTNAPESNPWTSVHFASSSSKQGRIADKAADLKECEHDERVHRGFNQGICRGSSTTFSVIGHCSRVRSSSQRTNRRNAPLTWILNFRKPAYDVWLSMTYFNRYLHTACTGWVGQHPSVAFLCEMHARVHARVSLQFINVHLRMENKRILHSLVISRSAMGVRCAGRAR